MEISKEINSLSTNELIDYCQSDEIACEISDEAFRQLIFKFREQLVFKCIRIVENRGYEKDIAYEIAERTFVKYGKSRNFKIEKCNQYTIEDSFVVYLFKIARNQLNDYFKEEQKRKKGLLYDGSEKIITNAPNVDVSKLSIEDKIIHETVLTLPYSHKVIFYTYSVYERDGVNLPRKLQAELRAHLGGISQKTVRTYKKEAKDKIASALEIITKMSQANG